MHKECEFGSAQKIYKNQLHLISNESNSMQRLKAQNQNFEWK
jgi:hypothetical protein